MSFKSYFAISLIDKSECLPGTYCIAVGHNSISSAALCTDVLAVGGLNGYVAKIYEIKRLPCADIITVSYDFASTATFRT